MSTQLIRIASRLFNRPLLLHPGAAEVVASVLASRVGADPIVAVDSFQRPQASRMVGVPVHLNNNPDAAVLYTIVNGSVAVVPVVGELINRGAYIGASSGLVSYEGIQAQLRAAAIDERVRSLVIDEDTPGGEAVGAFETGQLVAKINAEKPVSVFVNGMSASAGYAIAGGAGRIFTTETGLTGSIGVVCLHVDRSEQLASAGLKPTLIFAGAHKVDGNSLGPLSAEIRADIQAEIDHFYDLFVKGLAAGPRGLTEAAARATEARTYIGRQAVDVGLADDVAAFDDVIAEALKPRGTNLAPPARSKTRMSNEPLAPVADPAPAPAAIADPAPPPAPAPTPAPAALADIDRSEGAVGLSARAALELTALAFPNGATGAQLTAMAKAADGDEAKFRAALLTARAGMSAEADAISGVHTATAIPKPGANGSGERGKSLVAAAKALGESK